MKRLMAITATAMAVIAGMTGFAPGNAQGATIVTYANCVGILPGISNLLSTSGNANRIWNKANTCLPQPPNRALRIRNLLSGGGVVGEQGGLNYVITNFSSPYPYSKSQCWVPAGNPSGVNYCDTYTQ